MISSSNNSASSEAHQDRVTRSTVIVSYMLVSSLLLVVNKLSIHYVQGATVVLLLQFCVSALLAWLAGRTGLLEVDRLEKRKLLAFVPAAVAQMLTIYTGTKALQACNVDTFIIFRCSTPIALAVIDALYLGREWPAMKSSISLAVMVVSTSVYVLTDKHFAIRAYFWIFVWYVAIIFDFAYLKHVVDTVPMSTFGRVLYQNLIGAVILAALTILTGEANSLSNISGAHAPQAWLVLAMGCVLGFGMSGLSSALRAMTTSAQMAILGNMCKVLSVLINLLIWDKHASTMGLVSLLACLVAGFFYHQAPRRTQPMVRPSLKKNRKRLLMLCTLCTLIPIVFVNSHSQPVDTRVFKLDPYEPVRSRTTQPQQSIRCGAHLNSSTGKAVALSGMSHCTDTDVGLEPTWLYTVVHDPNMNAFDRQAPIIRLDVQVVPLPASITMTITIPIYNTGAILLKSLPKLFEMTSGNWELIIVLDACYDDSLEIVRKVVADHWAKSTCLRVRVVEQPTAVWETSSNNIAMRMSNPTELYVLTQGDILMTEFAWNERVLLPFEQNKQVFAVSGRCCHSFSGGNAVGRCTDNVAKPLEEPYDRTVLHIRETCNRGPLALRATVARDLGFLDEKHIILDDDDHDIIFRASQQGYIAGHLPVGFHSPMEFSSKRNPQFRLYTPAVVKEREKAYFKKRNTDRSAAALFQIKKGHDSSSSPYAQETASRGIFHLVSHLFI